MKCFILTIIKRNNSQFYKEFSEFSESTWPSEFSKCPEFSAEFSLFSDSSAESSLVSEFSEVLISGWIARFCKDSSFFSPSVKHFRPWFVVLSQLWASQQISLPKIPYWKTLRWMDCKELSLLRPSLRNFRPRSVIS